MKYWNMLTPYGKAWVSGIGLIAGMLFLLG